jgi:hypothetical protein
MSQADKNFNYEFSRLSDAWNAADNASSADETNFYSI